MGYKPENWPSLLSASLPPPGTRATAARECVKRQPVYPPRSIGVDLQPGDMGRVGQCEQSQSSAPSEQRRRGRHMAPQRRRCAGGLGDFARSDLNLRGPNPAPHPWERAARDGRRRRPAVLAARDVHQKRGNLVSTGLPLGRARAGRADSPRVRLGLERSPIWPQGLSFLEPRASRSRSFETACLSKKPERRNPNQQNTSRLFCFVIQRRRSRTNHQKNDRFRTVLRDYKQTKEAKELLNAKFVRQPQLATDPCRRRTGR